MPPTHPFFVKLSGGEASLPAAPFHPRSPLYRIASCRGAGPNLPRPVPPPRVPSRPVRPTGRRAAQSPRSSSNSPAAATSCPFPPPSLSACPSAEAGGERGQPVSHGRDPPLGCTPQSVIATAQGYAVRALPGSAALCLCVVWGREAAPADPATLSAVLFWGCFACFF